MKLQDLSDDGEGPELDSALVEDSVVVSVEEFLEDLEDLIEDDHVQYARSTLEGIYESVERTGRVTEAQRQAVENIDEGGRRPGRRW